MDSAPNAEQLTQRVRILFGVVSAGHSPEGHDSPYARSEHIENFDVAVAGVDAGPVDPAKIAAAWLATPNPSFGGLCPQNFIDGTDDQRAFLAAFLSSIEDGAFS